MKFVITLFVLSAPIQAFAYDAYSAAVGYSLGQLSSRHDDDSGGGASSDSCPEAVLRNGLNYDGVLDLSITGDTDLGQKVVSLQVCDDKRCVEASQVLIKEKMTNGRQVLQVAYSDLGCFLSQLDSHQTAGLRFVRYKRINHTFSAADTENGSADVPITALRDGAAGTFEVKFPHGGFELIGKLVLPLPTETKVVGFPPAPAEGAVVTH